MDFIFMLTRNDRTVEDCLEVLDEVAGMDVMHIGFKDVGATHATLSALHRKIVAAGATSYLEVVSTDREQALESARFAADLGVDWLMGGTWVEETLDALRLAPTRYLPFAGTPTGRPTVLGGSPEQVAEHCRRFDRAGCAGVDLLAYRATEAAPLDLVRSARRATAGRLVVAGDIKTATQIANLAAAGVDAFTIGSALFSGSIAPGHGTLRNQLQAVQHLLGQHDRRMHPRRVPSS